MSEMATIEFGGQDNLARWFEGFSDAVRAEMLKAAVMAGGQFLEANIKVNIEKQKLVDTGNMMNAWHTVPGECTSTEAEAIVGTDVPYNPIHEFGGIIKAKNAKALRFRTKDGAWHTVKAVRIPARPHVRPAINDNKDKIAALMVDTLRRKIEGTGK